MEDFSQRPLPYTQERYINEPISNNAFSFDQRTNTTLRVAPLREGNIQDVKLSQHIAFEDFDEYDQIQTCYGLENFILTRLGDAPTYIFDNHNHAFTFWCYEYQKGTIGKGATVVHIDQHKDTRKPEIYLNGEDIINLPKVENYTNTILNVGSFIVPAQQAGLVDELIIIDSQASIEAFTQTRNYPEGLILDIDLDFFSKDMDYIPQQQKVDFIRQLIPKAQVITFATSPFFIEQEKALHWLGEIAEGFENNKKLAIKTAFSNNR